MFFFFLKKKKKGWRKLLQINLLNGHLRSKHIILKCIFKKRATITYSIKNAYKNHMF
jgi:hypothetical protein